MDSLHDFSLDIAAFQTGTFVVAVSGGVDSIVLLHLLTKLSNAKLIVAHVDHGIRPDSKNDAEFVGMLAKKYGHQFEGARFELGPDVSEEKARNARYGFLWGVAERYGADALVLAHHHDDVLETMAINMIRGTGWRGLVSMTANDRILRPLLTIDKSEIVSFAERHRLEWREDSTNSDTRYLRNAVRQKIKLAKMNETGRINDLSQIHDKLLPLSVEINQLELDIFDNIIEYESPVRIKIKRYWLIMCGDEVALECLRYACRRLSGGGLLNRQAEFLLIFAKTAGQGHQMSINGGLRCNATLSHIIVTSIKSVIS